MIMTYDINKTQVQRPVGSKDSVETDRQAVGQTLAIALPSRGKRHR